MLGILKIAEARFQHTPKEMGASKLLDLAEKILDQGIPLPMGNKWLKPGPDGSVIDGGGHLTLLIGYETRPDGTRWYRVKDSRGMTSETREWPNSKYPITRVDGYTYWERSVLEKALTGFLAPSVFVPN
jgi:hypothetical protein